MKDLNDYIENLADYLKILKEIGKLQPDNYNDCMAGLDAIKMRTERMGEVMKSAESYIEQSYWSLSHESAETIKKVIDKNPVIQELRKFTGKKPYYETQKS